MFNTAKRPLIVSVKKEKVFKTQSPPHQSGATGKVKAKGEP